ncbi:MAG TPA: hypothetical protein VNW15_16750 [Rhizomicrobium sp.]|nr:hypothetical protein [Rhizomicrobium sp.]
MSLHEAFAALGMNAPIVTDAADVRGTAIALGPHMLEQVPYPQNLILYNLEQVYQNPLLMTPSYVELLKRYPVWDYSVRNIAAMAQSGVQASLCGIGYMPGLTRIPAETAKDIDVLFIGSMNPRRGQALDRIAAQGATIRVAFNTYGEERDALIARAKIVLNLHFYQAKVFEIVRVSYLLANRVCVVSETGLDAELESPFLGGVAFAGYDGLPQACLRLLGDGAARQRIAQKGFEQMCALSQIDMLRRALATTP